MRFAGTCNEYSASAIIQLSRIAHHRGDCCQRKCPYHATVITDVDSASRIIVHMQEAPESVGSGQWAVDSEQYGPTCSLPTAHCPLVTAHCPLVTGHCPL